MYASTDTINKSFINACKIGDEYLVELCLEAGADVEFDNYDSLYYACSHGHIGVIMLLLERGVNLDLLRRKVSEIIENMLYEMSINDSEYENNKEFIVINRKTFWDIFLILVQQGITLNDIDSKTLYTLACETKDEQQLEVLIDLGLFDSITLAQMINSKVYSGGRFYGMVKWSLFIDYYDTLDSDSLYILLTRMEHVNLLPFEKIIDLMGDSRPETAIRDRFKSTFSLNYEVFRLMIENGFPVGDKFPIDVNSCCDLSSDDRIFDLIDPYINISKEECKRLISEAYMILSYSGRNIVAYPVKCYLVKKLEEYN